MKVGFGLAESDGQAWGEDEIRAADCRDFSDRDRGDLGSAGDQCAAWEFYDGADAMGLPGRIAVIAGVGLLIAARRTRRDDLR